MAETKDDFAEAVEADENLSKPMQIADSAFMLTLSDELVPNKAEVKAALLADIEARSMAPFYESLCGQLGWTTDQTLLAKMKASNEEELKAVNAKIEDAKANLGHNEVLDAVQEKADFLARIGEQDKVAEAYKEIPDKSVSKGQQIDVVLHMIRIAFFRNDLEAVKLHVEDAKKKVEAGGDWDRRNRLKVYEATYCMCIRDFKKAAQLLLDSVATFTCLEMFSYKELIFYTVMCSVLAMDRVTIKTKVIDSPDVLSLILEIPDLSPYLNSLHDCDYRLFFQSLVAIHPSILRDRYLSRHSTYFVREMRIKAFSQFLDSYLSVTVESMAASFGISVGFLDRELSTFIASGRLNAKIDKIDGVIVTSRADSRTADYQSVLKHGDALLNRIQRLARVTAL